MALYVHCEIFSVFELEEDSTKFSDFDTFLYQDILCKHKH